MEGNPILKKGPSFYLLALVFLFVPVLGLAQSDLSFWGRRTDEKTFLFPWYMYDGKYVFIDARYNFDAEKSAGAFVGKALKKGPFVLVPEAGMIFGKYNGFSPELIIMIDTKRVSFFSQNQYSLGLGKGDTFAYHWTDCIFNVNKWLAIGAGEQVFKEHNAGLQAQVDVGPSVKITVKKMYVRYWPSWSVGPANAGRRTIFAGIGYVF